MIYPPPFSLLSPQLQFSAVVTEEKTLVAQDIDKKSDYEQAVEKPPAVKPHRTIGLRLFDIGLYPVLTNFGVFAISVAATYLTSHGADRGKNGKLIFGRLGAAIQKRGDMLMDVFKNWGMNHKQADMSKMVFFSFVDGSLLAPVVKLFEDRREKIAKRIDEYLGTVPNDLSVYDAEPKQGWLSVLGGRLATVSIVVPTAVALEKAKFKDGFNLNDKLFKHPGEWLGKKIAKRPNLAKYFGQLHIPALFGIAFFEAFYTSVCTAGLYVSSRLFASWGDKKKPDADEHKVETDPTIGQSTIPEIKPINHAAREAERKQTAATSLASLAL